ncbi:AbrB/MazE/SpoVT family DNA-binding domain-containing protein [Beggiatoa leptomitoformis]|uniref:AbrB/MazE/SpoVT family DNA-binding domain-containing protein n=1 Tax=Beggiatoa leptomitoformis TaxID=288004 RepID=A0A2N9YFS5_9GAMM|nr:AbrB/MazE/SpoVT family DNA-binding domain-containing protein [Beggiatoa leptomitoformis]ALG68342.1 AbrB/MazE/SpoVT family DNA-binding domain-containing protein [Beggiatoa leptomitoformis]AUI69340.1 AbrB/MazE/SpoVT family DNA-binding domain-containing protein [Beggiatoa leptomitoformis]
MATILQTSLVKIGNSRGVRIPKSSLQQLGIIDGKIEMELTDNELIIRPLRVARQGWDVQFQKMANNGDDTLLDESGLTTEWDSEWQW